MHAVYNYSGFVDLVTSFRPTQPRVNATRDVARDRHKHEPDEQAGSAAKNVIPAADDH